MSFRPLTSAQMQKKSKNPPPDEPYQEPEYLKSLGEKQQPVSIKLRDGEIVKGWIEYYDRDMIRLTRERAPNLYIFKHDIMYIAEVQANGGRTRQCQCRPARGGRRADDRHGE